MTVRILLVWIAGAGAMLLAGAADAGVYKWVDKNGRVQYGDRPPPDASAKTEQVNMSGVPLALQERLRALDQEFNIKRITGNLDVAHVCLEVAQDQREDPPFVASVQGARLGEIKAVGAQESYDYDDSYRSRYRKSDGRCPEQRIREGMRRRIYEIRFDPKAVNIYRGRP